MITRRTLLRRGALLAGAGMVARFTPSAWAQPVGANDAIRVGVIGLGLKGAQLAGVVASLNGVRVVALCDVDPRRLEEARITFSARQGGVFATTDLRVLLERNDVDAVVIATGTHWHALATIWACQAGKDVYVEKPVGRTVQEGRKIIEAAARYGRMVQTGTQLRSDVALEEVLEFTASGRLGALQWLHGFSYVRRPPVVRRLPWYPAWLDYDLFCGPAPVRPLRREELHSDWHWSWDTGNGDLVNMGVHMVDVARRFVGDEAMPRRIVSMGGRYAVDDAAETPNTQLTVFDFGGLPVLFENRALPIRPGATYSDNLRGLRHGLIAQFEHGYYAGYYGGAIFDNEGRKLLSKSVERDKVTDHLTGFFDAVRSRRQEGLTAPPQVGHDSARFCHYGNLSYRAGRPTGMGEAEQSLQSMPIAVKALDLMRLHLGAHGVDLQQSPLTVGPWLELSETDDGVRAVEGDDASTLAYVQHLINDVHRAPFLLPDQV